ncbi:cupin domain-containing protein [Massilia aerilata]|uniref:Cupin domain-containing protein n=1 Tax=Massilia aerilata TaxID=453817 RepID=A0ABW0RYE1_9BURK
MLVNADFSQPVIVEPSQYQWVASPQAGVERMMLDRIGVEKARATSIVRYAPDSRFPPHEHPGGEEILVLAGTFSDETGDFPAGWYLRNPDGTSHQPSSAEGALIFVKLRQMAPDDKRRVRIDTRQQSAWLRYEDRMVCPLFSSAAERVSLQRVGAGHIILTDAAGGAELLVLEGRIVDGDRRYKPGAWIRLPAGERPGFTAGEKGVRFYLKTGHLAHPVMAE